MDPGAVGALIPIVAIAGFFALMITRTLSKVYTARLEAQRHGAAGGGQEDVLAALDDLRREVAELAERVDFTERLLAKPRDGQPGNPR